MSEPLQPLVNITDSIGPDGGWQYANNVSAGPNVAGVGGPSVARSRAPRVGLRGGRRKQYSLIEKFWARVVKTPTCWLFSGAPCDKTGHLQISGPSNKRIAAHRFSYELHKGPIPAGLIVRHTCDVGACVNPDHLLVGTQRDNVHDAMRRGRRPVRRAQDALQTSSPESQQAQGDLYVVNVLPQEGGAVACRG